VKTVEMDVPFVFRHQSTTVMSTVRMIRRAVAATFQGRVRITLVDKASSKDGGTTNVIDGTKTIDGSTMPEESPTTRRLLSL